MIGPAALAIAPMTATSIAEVEPFLAIALSRIAHDLKAQGQDVIHMEFGQPSTGAPAAAIAEAHRILDADPMGYWESTGLKQRIARAYVEDYGVQVDPEQVMLTCGASPALVMALSCLFAPGARVALARPGYVAYRNTLKSLYLEPVEMACGSAERFQVTAAALDALDPVPDAPAGAPAGHAVGRPIGTDGRQGRSADPAPLGGHGVDGLRERVRSPLVVDPPATEVRPGLLGRSRVSRVRRPQRSPSGSSPSSRRGRRSTRPGLRPRSPPPRWSRSRRWPRPR